MKKTPIREIMTSPAITVQIDEPFSHVEEKLRVKGIRHLPVVDDNHVVVGLITQRDLYRTLSPHRNEDGDSVYDAAALDAFILKRIMTSNPATLTPDNMVAEAVNLMAAGRYGCIPIVDVNKKIVGIVTETNILKYLAKLLREE
ncbi:MAG: CBS domain-containing protein [Candidatus Omnitrophica bacterium]|nr:CBS domain-containing protein [Candidatus Omnitrophota bacterium]